jgi:hypothetical protein
MARKAAKGHRWSQEVTGHNGVFPLDSPRNIAESLKKSLASRARC